MIDGLQMERALTNLITNAIDASDKGQEVLISGLSEKNSMVIKIKDHGSGMDRETFENIFTPFYTKKKGGTGLGMPIAKKIIEEHQGKIYVQSRSRVGTEVTIKLPYKYPKITKDKLLEK